MKKLLTVLLSAMMLVGCSTSGEATTTPTAEASAEATTETTATGDFKVGIGSSTSISASDASADKDGQVQVNTTVAMVVLEGDVIKSVSFDVAQNAGKFDATGTVTTEEGTATPTKKEKGADYGMAGTSAIGKEWFEQVAAFEEYCVGKTVAEVTGMPTKSSEDGSHEGIADVEDLTTSCTISLTEFFTALEAAAANATPVVGATQVAWGTSTEMSYTSATADKDGSVQSNVTYTVIALDANNAILYTYIDVAQNSGKFDATGVAAEAKAAPTKKEKMGDYGMASASAIGKEWYEQAEAFETYTAGKTIADVTGMPTKASEDGSHEGIADVEDLTTSCTISVTEFINAMTAASKNVTALN